MRVSTRCARVAGLCLALCALTSGPARAQAGTYNDYNMWGITGSTGVVDDGDTGKVALNERTINFKSSVTLPASAIVRYHMPAGAMGQWGGGANDPTIITPRFLDNGAAATVNIKIKRSSYTANTVDTIWNWSSDTDPGLVTNAYRTGFNCLYVAALDFNPFYSYWVEVELTKRDATGSVGFAEILVRRGRYEEC